MSDVRTSPIGLKNYVKKYSTTTQHIDSNFVFTGTNTFNNGLTINDVSISGSNNRVVAMDKILLILMNYFSKKDLLEKTGVIIPLYVYPSDIYNNTDYNNIINIKKKYHDVPLVCILNPSSGPGVVVDGNYLAAIKRLDGAGALPIGYVSTSWAARDINDVKADIDKWIDLYPQIRGIFLDEMSNVTGSPIQYYSDLTLYCRQNGLRLTVGNPSAAVPKEYFDARCVDVTMIYETSGMPSESFLKGDFEDGFSDYNYRLRAAIAYNVEYDKNTIEMVQKYVGLLYFTQDNLPNPWDSISTYLEDIFKVLSSNGSLYENSNGSVGIGTDSPTHKLSVAKDIRADSDIVEGQLTVCGATSTNKRLLLGYDTSTTHGSAFIKAGNATQTWTTLALQPNGGNVGIGTTTPKSKLSIVGLPTSASGLSAGDVWNDGGTLKIVS